MVTLARLLWFLPLFALLAVFPSLASGAPAPVPKRTVEGVATTPDGKPLAHVMLYLFGLPPGQTDMIMLGEQSTVVTDEQGRFTWAVPDALPPLSAYIGVRSIACYALAADQSMERLLLTVRPNWHGTDATGAARDLLGQVTRPCETKWLTGGEHPVFSVVVPDTSAVEMVVRGPDGKPVREREVQVVPVGLTFDYKGAAIDIVRTDTAGRLRLRCFPGSLRFQVFVPGLGFGSTGTFDAAAGQSVMPSMPPLAPFARISGTVASALAAPGAVVHQDSLFASGNVWYDPHGVVDAEGHWTMADVLPGTNHLVLTGGRGESESVSVAVQPGQHVSDITVGPKQPDPVTPGPLNTLPGAPSSDATLSVRGKVTEADGRPAAGADVYAVCSPSQGMFRSSGRSQQVLAAKTDGAGAYIIAGLPVGDGQRGTSVHLVARQPGFSLAVGDGQSEEGPISGRWEDIEKDLVLPSSHAGLAVRVLQDGKPCPNVLVALTAQGESSLIPDMYRESDRGDAAQALRKILFPISQTVLDGTVRFTDLTPGLWDVTANRNPYSYSPPGTSVPPFNTSRGVVVQAGRDQSYTLSLLPVPSDVAFRILSPTSVPPFVGRDVVTLKTADNPNYGNLSFTQDSAGNGLGQFIVPGLFQVTARFADKPLNINALAGPYYEGTGWVAVSAATTSSRPLTITTQHIGPASLRVRLVDAQGKPLRGTVTIDPFDSALYSASVDAGGVAVFHGLPVSFFPYTATAHIEGRPNRVVLSTQPGPLPSDAALIAGTGQPMRQAVHVKGGEEAVMTFGRVPTGYVRLRLTGPFASESHYYIEGRQTDDEPFTEVHFDPATGEYLLGPLPPGSRTFHLFRNVPTPVDANLNAGEVTVTVKAGQVVSTTLEAQSTAAQEALYSSPLSGRVYLADGKTPAWGARVALFFPEHLVPLRMARTDTQGHLVLKDFWRDSARSRIAPPGNPSEPVVAAWLPGQSGAVVVPFQPGKELGLVLPPSVSLSGRVTVGGNSLLGLPSQFRVRAACQGKGRLNDALSVEATAQADGTWTLAGLTPGTYQVQAARDNIWLSGTQTITVGAGALPEMTLDIAPPGAPVIVTLEDAKGKPLRNQEVQIVRPEGPLTAQIWPATLTTDSAGSLRVDGLEAGHHVLTVPGRVRESLGFDVPAWIPTAPTTTRRIVLSPEP